MLRLQPQFVQINQWEALACKEGLDFEILDLSMPGFMSDEAKALKDECIKWYRDSTRAKSLHGFFIDINPSSGDPDLQRLSRNKCMKSCRLARQLGADSIVFHSSAFPFLRGTYLEEWAKSCAAFYNELANEYNIFLFIENSMDITYEPLNMLMKYTDKNVGVCLDIGHANYSDSSLREWFDNLGEYIGYMHLSDNMGKFDDHLPLGSGKVDWQLADRLYRDLKKDIPIVLETGNIENTVKSLEYLKKYNLFI